MGKLTRELQTARLPVCGYERRACKAEMLTAYAQLGFSTLT